VVVVVILIVELQLNGQDVGSNTTDASDGNPDAEKATLSEKPVTKVADTLAVVSLPWSISTDEGLTDIE